MTTNAAAPGTSPPARAADVGGPRARAAAPEGFRLQGVGVTLSTARVPLEILRDINFEVGQGEVLGIVGRSGTGKTTLLRVLGGLLRPTHGSITLDGTDMRGPAEQVVTVFQDYASALLPWRSVERNVGLPLERSLSRTERAARVAEALEMVGLQSRSKEYPWRLSGGMQQRVQIARALALRSRVLLMDEPFGALDAMTRASLQDQLLTLQRETGATVIFITHDIEEAVYLGDRVCLIAGAPGHISLQIVTDLPKPRDQVVTRELPRYLAIRHQIYTALSQEHHA